MCKHFICGRIAESVPGVDQSASKQPVKTAQGRRFTARAFHRCHSDPPTCTMVMRAEKKHALFMFVRARHLGARACALCGRAPRLARTC